MNTLGRILKLIPSGKRIGIEGTSSCQLSGNKKTVFITDVEILRGIVGIVMRSWSLIKSMEKWLPEMVKSDYVNNLACDPISV